MGYHQFIDELGNAYGSFVLEFIAADPFLEAGWYWTACFPGCLNDKAALAAPSDPVGPFETEEEAMRSAQHV